MSAAAGFEKAAAELARRIEVSVGRLATGENTVAVAFSGGVDSSLLAACAKKHARVVACTGYAEGSGDGDKAKRAASALGVELVTAKLSGEEVVKEASAMELPFQPTLMDRSLWCLYSSVAREAAAAGARVMLLGQLADELFGGYAKYSRALEESGEEEAKAMMESDFREYRTRGRVRDVGACARWVRAGFPYEDPDVTAFAASIPFSYKIAGWGRKSVLRRAAVVLGVPEDIAGAPKKAAQYSSGVQKLLAGARF